MTTTDTDLASDILSLLEKWGDAPECDQPSIHSDPATAGSDRLPWKDPGSIAFGDGGRLLVLLECYRLGKDPKYLARAERTADNLISHCGKTASGNYSLYTGRAGVVYALIQLYRINRNEDLLGACLEIIRPANEDYLHSSYVTNCLFAGRAGTLLVIFYLFQLTEAPFLLEYLHSFTKKIVGEAHIASEGIYWKNKEETFIRPASSFGKGTAGIGYVLSRIAAYFGNEGLAFLAEGTLQYENACWVESLNNWGDFRKDILDAGTREKYERAYAEQTFDSLEDPSDDLSWIHGATGIGFSRLALLTGADDDRLRMDADRVVEKLSAGFSAGAFTANGLLDGLAGAGLFFLHAGQDLDRPELYETARRIAAQLLNAVSDKPSLSGSLYDGDTGIVYFLLKAADPAGRNENLLIPFEQHFSDRRAIPATFDLSVTDVKKTLIGRHFPRTINLLDNIDPALFTNFCRLYEKEKPGRLPAAFGEYLTKLVVDTRGTALHELLKEVIALEQEKLTFVNAANGSAVRLLIDEWARQTQTVRLLNNPDSWLLAQTLQISDAVKLIPTRWNWSLPATKANPYQVSKNLLSPPQSFEIMLYRSAETGVVENDLSDSGLILHRFDERKTVMQALQEMKFYCQMQGEETLKPIAMNTGSKDVADFLARLDFLVLFKIRELIYLDILVIQP